MPSVTANGTGHLSMVGITTFIDEPQSCVVGLVYLPAAAEAKGSSTRSAAMAGVTANGTGHQSMVGFTFFIDGPPSRVVGLC